MKRYRSVLIDTEKEEIEVSEDEDIDMEEEYDDLYSMEDMNIHIETEEDTKEEIVNITE